jgi:hypothetical protein
MISLLTSRVSATLMLFVGAILLLPACATGPSLPAAPAMPADQAAPDYIIGPGDNVNILSGSSPTSP